MIIHHHQQHMNEIQNIKLMLIHIYHTSSLSYHSMVSTMRITTTKTKNWSQDEIEIYHYYNIAKLICKGHKLLPEQSKALEISVDMPNTTNNNLNFSSSISVSDNGNDNGNGKTIKMKTTLIDPKIKNKPSSTSSPFPCLDFFFQC